jgi:DNA-binding CsgD family transcriptional regulator
MAGPNLRTFSGDAAGNNTHERAPAAQPAEPNVNFSSIMGLDAGEGWHILQLSSDGKLTAATAAMRVLRFFFPRDTDWKGDLPAAWAAAFMEARNWGMSTAPSRTSKSISHVRDGASLTAHFVPGGEGGHIIVRVGHAAADPSLLGLTDRELEITALAGMGKTNVEIAFLLRISARTVQKHMEHIFRKLGIETRTALAMRMNAIQPVAMAAAPIGRPDTK